ncbi:MAG TPA: NAD(P)H-binding protein, partial [Gemmatimonadaceae bacterium]|nr:NAD(P)H-binding protein [Gemmatimonadaceae bacterium]
MPNEQTAPSPAPTLTGPAIGTRLVLVTGASGYVGGRLVRALDERGARVRCLARRPQDVAARMSPGIEVVGGDVLDAPSLERALENVDTAFYLVHGMGSRSDFRDQDRRGATNFALAARAAGVRRIVYLGGLGTATDLSPHLASRHEVGRILRDSGVPTIELRASIILGSGSLSFEMVRALVERLPVLVTPRWVRQLTQPIAIEDVIAYLIASSDAEV